MVFFCASHHPVMWHFCFIKIRHWQVLGEIFFFFFFSTSFVGNIDLVFHGLTLFPPHPYTWCVCQLLAKIFTYKNKHLVSNRFVITWIHIILSKVLLNLGARVLSLLCRVRYLLFWVFFCIDSFRDPRFSFLVLFVRQSRGS